MLNINFHKKKHSLAVTSLQMNKRRNNMFNSHLLQPICKCSQNGLNMQKYILFWYD